MLKILVEQEYGFCWWIWSYDGTKEELIADFKSGKIPSFKSNKKNKARGNFNGTMKKITLDEVEVHHFNPKYKGLWLSSQLHSEEEMSKVFKSREYKDLHDKYLRDLNKRWPIRAHIFLPDDTYLIIDGIKYKH